MLFFQKKVSLINCQLSIVNCLQRGFSLLETIIYIAILSLVLLLVSSFIFYFVQSHAITKGDRQVLENARRAMEIMTYEITGSQSIYTPTSSNAQLSLETLRYLPEGENVTYIDFFVCQTTRLCIKKESQEPTFLTSEDVEVENLAFTQISYNGFSSIKIDLTVRYKNTINGTRPSVSLSSSASLRKY